MATRLSVNINNETAASLQELAARHETSVTEIIRRAVTVYKFIDDETTVRGKTVQTVSSDDEVVTLAIVG